MKLNIFKIDELTAYQVGWLAGMIDGEGCIGLTPRGRVRPRITLISTTPKVMERVKRMTGVGHVHYAAAARKTYKRSIRWNVYSSFEIFLLLKKLLPHLIIKKQQARLMLKFCSLKLKKKKNYSPDLYCDEMSKLNKKGVTQVVIPPAEQSNPSL